MAAHPRKFTSELRTARHDEVNLIEPSLQSSIVEWENYARQRCEEKRILDKYWLHNDGLYLFSHSKRPQKWTRQSLAKLLMNCMNG